MVQRERELSQERATRLHLAGSPDLNGLLDFGSGLGALGSEAGRQIIEVGRWREGPGRVGF